MYISVVYTRVHVVSVNLNTAILCGMPLTFVTQVMPFNISIFLSRSFACGPPVHVSVV